MAQDSFNNWTATCVRDYSRVQQGNPYHQWVTIDLVTKLYLSYLLLGSYQELL